MTKILPNLLLLLCIAMVCTSCQDENVHSIMGVKVAGYSWNVKQAFLSKGFKVVDETEKFITMHPKWDDEFFTTILIHKGKWNRVLSVGMSQHRGNLDEQYEELQRELLFEYGDAQYKFEDDEKKVQEWEMYSNGELESIMKLDISYLNDDIFYNNIDLEFPYKATKPIILGLNLAVYNVKNIAKQSKEE